MKKVIQVIPNGKNSVLAISGVSTIFQLAQSWGLPIEYKVLSAQRTKTIQVGNFTLKADGSINDHLEADFIIIPSVAGNPHTALAENARLIQWLKTMHAHQVKIASLCTGVYFLAATGLLKGQEASSHCNAIADLKAQFPDVHWAPDKIITDCNGLYTSGGTLSSFNVLIYLLGKYFDRQVAHRIAKFIQLEYPRTSQRPFFIFSNQKNHIDEQILAIQDYLEQHVDQFINLDNVAKKFGLSRRSLNRRFKIATGDNPRTYIQRIKIEQVKEWLQREDITIHEAILRIGYNDTHSFRRLFKKMTGMRPSEYKQKFTI